MVDFSPLFKTLEEKEMNLSDLRQVISSRTQTSIKENHMQANLKMYIGTLEKFVYSLMSQLKKSLELLKNDLMEINT